jgi:hypothetical protein
MTKFGIVFVLLLLGTSLTAFTARPGRDRPLVAGVAANERLTALLGAPLYILLAAIAVTITFVRALLPLHYAVGLLLIPPIGLKLASTGYRFVRYYSGDRRYRLAGAPAIILRLTAPLLGVSTAAVFITGLELWLFGLRLGNAWMTAHTLSAVIMVAATGVHVVGHLGRSRVVAGEELALLHEEEPPDASDLGPRRSVRRLVAASLALGVALALLGILYASPFPAAAVGT